MALARSHVPSIALLRSLKESTIRPVTGALPGCARRLCTSRLLLEERTPTAELKKSFRGQLYESTADRMRKQREEQVQYGASPASHFARNISIVFTVVGFAVSGWFFGSSRPYEKYEGSTMPLARMEKLRHSTTKNNMQLAWVDLVMAIGEANVSESEQSLHGLVAFPQSTEDVSAIMKVAHARRIPVTAYSGGTSLEGHFAPTRAGICVDFSHMSRIISLKTDDLDITVQPGVGWEQLDTELKPHGLHFPPDPGPGALIGGMIGTGCSGTNAYCHGTMRDWVLNLTLVLADGSVVKTRQRPRKSSAGYDLTRLIIGSEGTLALVTEATLKLAVRPPKEQVAISTFGSIRDAAACAAHIVRSGLPLAAIELLDAKQMQCINKTVETGHQYREVPTLFLKFAGTPATVKEQIDLVRSHIRSQASTSFTLSRSTAEADELWSARKMALQSVLAQRSEGDHVWTTDVAVPLGNLATIIEETQADLHKSGLMGTIVGHVGDGNFHAIMLFNDKQRGVAEALVSKMVKRAVELDGTISGEHGVGLVKRDYLPAEIGQAGVDTMRKIKWSLDPRCILNPDKVFRLDLKEQ